MKTIPISLQAFLLGLLVVAWVVVEIFGAPMAVGVARVLVAGVLATLAVDLIFGDNGR